MLLYEQFPLSLNHAVFVFHGLLKLLLLDMECFSDNFHGLALCSVSILLSCGSFDHDCSFFLDILLILKMHRGWAEWRIQGTCKRRGCRDHLRVVVVLLVNLLLDFGRVLDLKLISVDILLYLVGQVFLFAPYKLLGLLIDELFFIWLLLRRL
jgi:hypothetical protein